MKKLLLPALIFSSMSAAGCLVVDHRYPHCSGDLCGSAPGDIQFYWAFELADGSATELCDIAGVARVDLTIYDYAGYVEFEALDRPCSDAGAVITDFTPGDYDINLVGICRSGAVTHEGWWSIFIEPGMNDYGTLVLERLGSCY